MTNVSRNVYMYSTLSQPSQEQDDFILRSNKRTYPLSSQVRNSLGSQGVVVTWQPH